MKRRSSGEEAAPAAAAKASRTDEKRRPTGLERFTLGKRLGEGGFASVRLATDAVTKGDVAVKFMWKRRTSAKSAHNERDVLRALGQHEHIVSLICDFETADAFCLVLELVTGGEVFDKVATQGAFSEADAATVVRSVARALQHLHSQNIVHRDLKPENLLLTASDDVKVADFGLGALYGPGHPPLTLQCGTINYVAPEMLAGGAPYTEAVDLWSLGALVFTLLGAYCAFDPCANLPHDSVRERIKSNMWDFERFPQQWAHVSEAARSVIRSLLEPDVAKRSTAEKLLAEPWVVGVDAPKQPLPPGHRKKLQEFQEGRRVWRAAVDAAALFLGSPHMSVASAAGGESDAGAALPETAEEELRRAFAVYDKDGNGSIDLDELRDVMTSLHVGGLSADAAAVNVMQSVDTDGDGSVSFDEFKVLVRPLYDASSAALRKIFELFDEDKSGFIDTEELGIVLQRLGLGKGATTLDALDKVFAAADTDGDGKVDFLEFTSLFARAADRSSAATDSTV